MGQTNNLKLALFGESNVGKTHYGAQLLTRIEVERGLLKLRRSPGDMSLFRDVRKRLSAGLSAEHTPAGTYREAAWPVYYEGDDDFELVWPDYAGEQVSRLLETRRIDHEWLDRTRDASGWILMVRPSLAKSPDDIFSKPLGDLRQQPAPAETKLKRSVQANLIELLQMLLYVKRMKGQTEIPPLAVMLSCWDELRVPAGTIPADLMAEFLPMVSAFIKNAWGSRAIVYGVSALGEPLAADKPNERYIDSGPENFGEVTLADGRVDSDLTLPIAELAKLVRAKC